MKNTPRISLLLTALVTITLLLISLPAFSATSTVSLTVGGSTGPIAATTGTPVVFDVVIDCGAQLINDLVYVPGSVHSKDFDPDSEIAWEIRNDTASILRINKFGVSWNCLNDSGSVCSNWKFDYMRFNIDNQNKIFRSMAPVDNSNSFPLTIFDTNVGDSSPYNHPYIDIAAGETVPINEMEFVDSAGDKYKNIPSGTSVEFTVTWGDTDGNTHIQIFTLTW